GVLQQPVAAAVGVDLRLGHRVRGRERPGLDHLQQGVVVADHVGAADDAAGVGERVGGRQVVQRLVAGVLHGDDVADLLAGGVGGAPGHAGGLGDVQGRVLLHRHAGVGGVVGRLVGVGGRGVLQQPVAAAVGVDLRLGHRVGGGETPGLADFEQGVVVAHHVGAADDAAGVGERVGHRHVVQGLVAGVLHGDDVADLLAGGVRRAPGHAGGLRDVQGLVLYPTLVRSGGVVGRLVGVGG